MDSQPQLDLKDLYLVRAIAECDGVTAAARALHLSQSAVSHHLARIEGRLGVQLFARVGRTLKITAEGELLAALSHELGARVSQVEGELRARAGRREIRLTTQCYTTYHWLPSLLERFAEQSPSVRVRIVFDAARDPFEQLRLGKLDLAMCHCDIPDEPRLVSTPVMKDPLVVLTAATHRLAQRKRVRASDLVDEVVLTHDLPGTSLEQQGRELFTGTPGPRRVERIPLTEAIVQLVRADRGVSILSRWAVASYATDPGLAFLPMVGPHTTRSWYALYDARSALRPAVEQLVQSIRSAPPGR